LSTVHPAAAWAQEEDFNAAEVDCTTAVALKILDNKCKMLPGEMAAVLAVYDMVKRRPGRLFDVHTHNIIERARNQPSDTLLDAIHALRLYAESHIPKPVMKSYKARLRDGLFG
jgi:hypothetical protein